MEKEKMGFYEDKETIAYEEKEKMGFYELTNSEMQDINGGFKVITNAFATVIPLGRGRGR